MKNVLVTDDEKSFLITLKEALGRDYGSYRILTAENGAQAVERMGAEPVDLLITDLRMPVMDGFELLAWVSTNRPKLPIIVMTAFGDADLESKLEPYNTLKCLEKPLDFSVLRDLVQTALTESAISNIHGVTLSAFLQLMSLEKKSCTLIIRSGGRSGQLYLKSGELINAGYGELEGMDAAIEILSWDNAEIEMDQVCRNDAVLIGSGIESILLEAHRVKDEQFGEEGGPAAQGETRAEGDFLSSIDDRDMESPAATESLDEPFGHEAELEVEEAVPEETREMLVKYIYGHKATQECCFFNHENIPEQTQTRTKCSQVDFDPSIFLFLAAQLDQFLPAGDFKWMSFSLASRNSYLFFKLRGCSLLVKLVKGARPQLVGTEYLNIVKMVMPNR